MAICDWPTEDRPREKLCQQGAEALSDSELLAIFLRTGHKGTTAIELARKLIKDFGGLRQLLEADIETFCQHKGLGLAKYSQIQASLEMAKRHVAQVLGQQDCFSRSADVKAFLTAKLRHLRYEVFVALFLDSQHQLITYEELFRGTVDTSSVYPREVVTKALQHHACNIIFAHNHPSGCANPSHHDLDLTRHLKQCLALIDVHTLDHVIVGDGECYSLAEHGQV